MRALFNTDMLVFTHACSCQEDICKFVSTRAIFLCFLVRSRHKEIRRRIFSSWPSVSCRIPRAGSKAQRSDELQNDG